MIYIQLSRLCFYPSRALRFNRVEDVCERQGEYKYDGNAHNQLYM